MKMNHLLSMESGGGAFTQDNSKQEGSNKNSSESCKNRTNATLAEVCTLDLYVSI